MRLLIVSLPEGNRATVIHRRGNPISQILSLLLVLDETGSAILQKIYLVFTCGTKCNAGVDTGIRKTVK